MSGNANLFARLAAGFPADRGRTFLETEGGLAVSFGDLLERAGRIAALLAASGIVPGDRVAVQVEKSVGNICLFLAVLQTGAVYVPLNSGYTPAELAHFLADAEPKVVICDPVAHDGIAPLVAGRGWIFTLGATGEGTLVAQATRLPSERQVASEAHTFASCVLKSMLRCRTCWRRWTSACWVEVGLASSDWQMPPTDHTNRAHQLSLNRFHSW